MKRSISIILFLVIASLSAVAQFTVSGKVLNESGAPLSGAVVHFDGSLVGGVTNNLGIYSIQVKEGKHVLFIEHLGYKVLIDTIEVNADMILDHKMKVSPLLSREFVVEATRANEVTPMTYQNIDKDQIEALNLAQDLPILLNQSISAVTTSDAGAGVGYTGIRIRGSDATRINVTINGVPLNDAESHGVFWVNMPDFATSTENIQIQRGVGTSSNGAAAFGATINLETSDLDSSAFVEINNSYGSFNTRRHNAVVNTGLFNDHFNVEGRLSYISSDGYIDRSAALLRSYYLSGGYFGKKMMLKAVTFAGNEVTQQAWWGTPESSIEGNQDEIRDHAARNGLTEEQTTNLLESGRTYNYYEYDNEIDNYSQDHYQLITGWQLSDDLYLNVTGHYTRGRGYFEQFKAGDKFEDFALPVPVVNGDSVFRSDFIVRRWLDNHFYGGVYNLQYRKPGLELTWGGGLNQYVGDHFGEVIWSEIASTVDIRDRYYESAGTKLDGSSYLKTSWTKNNLTFFADIQARYIDYSTQGVDNDQRPIDVDQRYTFLNPKGGVSLRLPENQSLYLSIARASREPVRSDFIDAAPGVTPRPEFLTDLETGWTIGQEKWMLSVNGYFMYYEDQLVLTGEVNDVGAPVRTNVDQSYRTGFEIAGELSLPLGFSWRPNVTLSQNKIVAFEELILDYTIDYEEVRIQHNDVDIAFSPNVIAGSQLMFESEIGLQIALLSKFVGRQFLDNTGDQGRSIDPYFVNDVRLGYQTSFGPIKHLELNLLINNIGNTMYSANGYTFSYIYEDLITENFYYPQAGTNWLLGMKLRF